MRRKIRREGKRLSRETGVDFKKYRDPELAEKIGDLIGFAGEASGILLRRYIVLLSIIIILSAWIYMRGMNIIGVILFFCFGFLFSVCTGAALGMMKITEKGVRDSAGVLVMVLDFVKDVRKDTAAVKGKTGAEVPVSALVEGVSYGVFIPVVSKVVRGRLSLFAMPVNFVIENALFYFTRSLAAVVGKGVNDDAGAEQTNEPRETEAEKDSRVDKAIDEARTKIEPLADSVARKITIPAKILLTLTLLIGFPLLLVIYLIF